MNQSKDDLIVFIQCLFIYSFFIFLFFFNDCISHSTNTLGKGMNSIILPPAMGK